MKLIEAIKKLTEAGIESAPYEARELFYAFGEYKRFELLSPDNDCSTEEFLEAMERRINREPLQYIIGNVDFYRESYFVTPDVLIPRSDTEILVDHAVKNLPCGALFADLCCGSGCVGISTLSNTKSTRCIAVDISPASLSVAKKNAKINQVEDRVEFIECDLMRDIPEAMRNRSFDAILSNPPYVRDDVYEELESEIFHEPKAAFVGGKDGLDFYRHLTPIYKSMLKPDGFIAYEIGYDQADALIKIAEENGMKCRIIKDLSDNDRVAELRF